MKKKLLIAVPLLALVALAAWFFRPKHESLGEAYVSEKSVTLWSSMAQVREPLGTLRYGDRVDMQAKRNDFVKVKTAAGTVGERRSLTTRRVRSQRAAWVVRLPAARPVLAWAHRRIPIAKRL